MLIEMENEYLKTKKILIVEDDVSSRLYLNKILEKTGASLLNASDGKEAIEAVEADPGIDVILMDIQLPVIDGYGAAKKIRELRNDVVIIAQTAYSLLGDKEKIIASGFDDYIVKPIFPPTLLIEKLVKATRKR
jgi:CheY-like chemotaxis protein